jgi:pilus assembly protein CpaE
MTQPLTVVVLSTGLDNFKEIRASLSADDRVQLLAGGNDVEQLHQEIIRLKPMAAIISLGANSEQGISLIKRLCLESPKTALISAAQNATPDLLLQSLRAGAREFLQLPIKAEELKTVLDRVADFCAGQVEAPKRKGRMVAVFSSKGGCGTSFIATNLAASTGARTVLVDLKASPLHIPQTFRFLPHRRKPTWLMKLNLSTFLKCCADYANPTNT